MIDLVTVFATALGLVFLAELGDKTQLIAMGFGAKHSLRTVAIGLFAGFAATGALAAIVGGLLGTALPERPIAIGGGMLFIGFAIWTLIDAGNDKADAGDDKADAGADETGSRNDQSGPNAATGAPPVATRSIIFSIVVSIIIGELGDKTQLTTATLAAQNNPLMVWAGATIGAASASLVGALLGQRLGRFLSPTFITYASAALFAVFGAILLVSAT